MTTKVLGGIVAVILGIVMMCAIGGAAFLGGGFSGCTLPVHSGGPALTAPAGGWPPAGSYNSDQVGLAATIVSVGAQMGVPVRGWVIAVATAIQECNMTNPTGGDQHSIGLFHQRPSQGWGTPDQLHDPVFASGKFYAKLLTIPNWQQMALTDAAQAVQRSAYPDAYAKHEPDATMLVNTVGSSGSWAMAIDLEHCPSNCPPILSNGGSSAPGTPPATMPTAASADGSCTTGEAVLARAESWLTAWNGGSVPYLSSADPATWFQGYRRDCSGYASMALGLPGPGHNSAELAARATPITMTDLHPGDLLINPAPDLAGHVVIFEHWTDATMTSYVGYEQSGDGGTHHRTIPYPYFGGYQMKPYRLSK
jgi:hypothetical protein